jgi:hypothetical protein
MPHAVMIQAEPVLLSARVAKAFAKATGQEPLRVNIKMRNCQDVPKYLKRLAWVREESRKSTLQFD